MKCLYGTKRGVSVEKIYIIMRPSCKIVRNSKHPAISSNNYYFELLIYWWLNSINLLYLERSRFSLNYRFAVLKIFAPNCNVTEFCNKYFYIPQINLFFFNNNCIIKCKFLMTQFVHLRVSLLVDRWLFG